MVNYFFEKTPSKAERITDTDVRNKTTFNGWISKNIPGAWNPDSIVLKAGKINL